MRPLYSQSLISTYAGFRFLVTFILLLGCFALGSIATIRRFQVPGPETIDYIESLIVVFWSNQLLLLAGIGLSWVALYLLNAAEPVYYLVTKRTVIRRRDYETLKQLRRLGRIFGIFLLVAVILFIPILSPRGIGWLGYLFGVLGPIGTLAGLVSSLGFRIGSGFGDYRRLINFDFRRCTFDVAKIAPRSSQVQRAIVQKPEMVDIKQLLSDLSQLLGVQGGFLRLHSNTTAAYDHALREIKHNGFAMDSLNLPLILASDAEYPKIDELLHDHASTPSPMTVARANIRQLLWDEESDARIIDAYVEAARTHQRPVQVLALCHVHHATGRELPVDQIIDRLEQEKIWSASEGYVLIDGAQSVGNISVSPKLWEKCDFYAFCGHKWLLGTPTLGMLFTKRNPRQLNEWKTLTLPAGLSQIRDFDEEYDSTAIIESRASLEVSLAPIKAVGLAKIEEWNSSLAALFREILPFAEAGIYAVATDKGGIVAVRGIAHKIRKVANYLSYFYGSLTTFDSPVVPLKEESAIRFCFHCFHSRDDVFRLVERIRESPLV